MINTKSLQQEMSLLKTRQMHFVFLFTNFSFLLVNFAHDSILDNSNIQIFKPAKDFLSDQSHMWSFDSHFYSFYLFCEFFEA